MADTTPERLAELRRIAMAATQCVFEDAGNKIGIRSSDGVLYAELARQRIDDVQPLFTRAKVAQGAQ